MDLSELSILLIIGVVIGGLAKFFGLELWKSVVIGIIGALIGRYIFGVFIASIMADLIESIISSVIEGLKIIFGGLFETITQIFSTR